MTLKKAIEELYQAFSEVERPSKIINAECISCLKNTDEAYLLNTPLKKLNDHIFGGIMASCNAIEMGNECYKYFIPRILELTTISNFDFSFTFVDYVYRDFAKFDYNNKFNQKEILAIDNFFYCFLEQEFSKPEEERDEAELFNIAETGFNTIPFLEEKAIKKDWLEICNNLKDHIELQKKWAKSEEEFNLWTSKGTRQEIIDYIVKKK